MAENDDNTKPDEQQKPEPKPQEGQKPDDKNTKAAEDKPKPPWGSDDEFKPEKAWTRIQTQAKDIDKLRRQLSEMEPLAKAAQEAEDAKKSEIQRERERADRAEKERDGHASTATRLQVAMEKGLTASQAKRLVGSTREELETDADELLADLKPADKPPSAKDVIPGRPNDGQSAGGDDKPDPKRIAREALNRNNR